MSKKLDIKAYLLYPKLARQAKSLPEGAIMKKEDAKIDKAHKNL